MLITNKKAMFKYLILLILPFQLNAQTSFLKESAFPEKDFVVYASENNFTTNATYEIGRFEPKNVAFTTDHLGRLCYNMTETDNPNYSSQIASIFLKVKTNYKSFYYELDETQDVDMHQFIISNSQKLMVIGGRYSFHILDTENLLLSSKIIPGRGQYEGEDAMSPLFDALTYFDNEKFLLGNVQGFGVFCVDISEVSNPKELIQHKMNTSENELFYTFFNPTKRKKFDIIVAQVDPNSESTTIRNLFSKLKNIVYVGKNIRVPTNQLKQPDTEKFHEELLKFIQIQFPKN